MSVYDLIAAQLPAATMDTSTLTRRESWSKLSRAQEASESALLRPSPYPSTQQNRVGQIYTFSPKTTSISFPWPRDCTGLERIALSAKGDLQRVLSAFFARPITIATVYSNTFYHPSVNEPSAPLTLPNPTALSSVSRELPITQMRQVHLQCSSKIVCTATSTVRITSPTVAHLFLVEKYAIGQMFSRLGKVPEFELVSVGIGPVTDDLHSPPSLSTPPSTPISEKPRAEQLWRKYRLFMEDFECDILEVFPTREMFVGGLHWLEDTHGWAADSSYNHDASARDVYLQVAKRRPQTGLILIFGLGFLIMLAYELLTFFTGRSLSCPS
ncbi:hypothetical protein H0H92_006337 [Tricholoma furcatifolium]|nr:hypothetical protein H0H92_006337 [Tricholoma furcatifolium]